MSQPSYEELLRQLAQKDAEITRLKGQPVAPAPGTISAGTMQDSTAISGGTNTLIGTVAQLTIRSAVFNLPATPGQAAPKELLWRYLNRVVSETGALDLAATDPKAVTDDRPSEKARLALAAIFTSLDTLQTREREEKRARFSIYSRRQPIEEEQVRLSAIAFAGSAPAVALLGDPGSGKTTFANFLALCLAGEMLGLQEAGLKSLGKDWIHGPLLPVRVILRQFAARLPAAPAHQPGDDLWNHIVANLGTALDGFAALLREHLSNEGGLLLLDGLDEVPEASQRRQRVKEAVLNFQTQFPKLRILVTSRTYAYQKQEWRLPAFAEAVLAPFNEDQIHTFVDRWYAHAAVVRTNLTEADAQGRAALLKITLDRDKHIGELAARPLLLTLIVSLHAWRGGALPKEREPLYEDAIELLLDLWQRPKIVPGPAGETLLQPDGVAEWLKVPDKRIREELERLACTIHETQADRTGTADIPEAGLTQALVTAGGKDCLPEHVKEYIRDRAGLFIHRAEGVYCLPHRTFQEYLAARHLSNDGFPARLVSLLRSDVERWREVTLLAGAKVVRGSNSTGWQLVDHLCPTDSATSDTDHWCSLVAAQVLVETGIGLPAPPAEPDKGKHQRVVKRLVSLVEAGSLPVADRASAGILLGKLGDPRLGVGVYSDGPAKDLPEMEWLAVPKGQFIMGSRPKDGGYEDERPQFEFNIVQPYQLSRYPVTVKQYQAFVDDREVAGYEHEFYAGQRSESQRIWSKAGWAWREQGQITGLRDDKSDVFQTANHPRVNVSCWEAEAYCRWLTLRLRALETDHPQHLGADGEVRLPSEAEWERAARGVGGRAHPWSQAAIDDVAELARHCNTSATGIGHTSAVGLFPTGDTPKEGRNLVGFSDLAGNVLEWCATPWLGSYTDYEAELARLKGKTDDPNTPRVLRGGSWVSYDPRFFRCAFRDIDPPEFRDGNIGFRCVLVGGSAGMREPSP